MEAIIKKIKQSAVYVFFGVSVFILVVQVVQIWVADICIIPTNSMESAINPGDRIVVSKLGKRKINRYDLIIFNHPDDGGTQLIKRCIGMPGDTVAIRDGVVYINNNPIDTPPTVVPTTDYALDFPLPSLGWSVNNYGPVITPAKGMSVMLDSMNMSLYRYVTKIERDYFDADSAIADQEYIFRTNNFFVLGDNRGNSIDSRYWGFVPIDAVVGKALFVYFSKDKERKQIRWNRIGKRLK